MLATLFLIGGALAGALVARRVLRGVLVGAECVLWGVVAGWMFESVCVYALARAQGRLAFWHVAAVTEVAWLAALLLLFSELRRRRREGARPFGWRAEYAGLALVLFAFAPVFLELFPTRMLQPGAEGIYSGGNSRFDMAFHAAVATSFLEGGNFPPVYTPRPPEPLLYPFMPDFQTAALMEGGLTLHAALLASALPLAFSLVGLFYFFALRVARSRLAAVTATFLFLLNGGFGFLYFFEDFRAGGKGLFEFWDALPQNYANMWGRGFHWVNLVADGILPQRTNLYGLPVALMVFTLFAAVWSKARASPAAPTDAATRPDTAAQAHSGRGGDETCATRVLLVAGVLAGLLPLFHMHAYFSVGFVSVALFTLRPGRSWLAFWVPALLLASPQLLGAATHAAGGGFVHLQFGWMVPEGTSFVVYLAQNFGPPILLAVPAWLLAPRGWRTFYLAFLALFVFSLAVVVSPNVFDNGKLMQPWHAFNSVLVGWLMARLATTYPRRLLALVLVLTSIASGVAALKHESLQRALVFDSEEVAAADYVRRHTEPRALFLTAPVIEQPVLCLAGRATLRGPTFWLWSHGYEFRDRERDVRAIYSGGAEALGLLRYYDIAYVYLGAAERRDFKADAAFFDANFDALYRGRAVTVYDTRAGRERGPVSVRADAHAPRELAARVGRDPFALVEEFPRVGFDAYKLLRASTGRAPRRGEFVRASEVLGRGLYVGSPGWERKLEENRAALAYELAEGDESRRDALLRAAADTRSYAREYDSAYVLTHFFAYLGRDPFDPPDSGFDFWLRILRRTRDYRSLSRAFLESEEYKQSRER
ncbi:MAG TPA: hypothetical protein VKB12_19800 [Pyrinomonadaceae bacterium]|nr:hypothetical protein [Pyrinomonadaceae bacterium]